MKKLLSFLTVTLAMVAGLSGPAQATGVPAAPGIFGDLKLVRIVYEKVGLREVATDLGAVKDIIAGARTGTKVYGGGADAFTNLIGNDFANLRVTYLALDQNAQDFWVSAGAIADLSTGKWLGIRSNVSAVLTNYYRGVNVTRPTTSSLIGAKANASSYYTKLAFTGLQEGWLSGFFMNGSNSEARLTNLATTGFVEQSLYFWDTFTAPAGSNVVKGQNVWEHLKLRTMADGSTVVTPIPGALVLFGTGLLGLIGIRRKAA